VKGRLAALLAPSTAMTSPLGTKETPWAFDGAIGGRQAFDRQQVLGFGARTRCQVARLAEVYPLA
jgi:hypothetical protein